jgi:DNA polymerase-3 subunit epsilon
MRASSSDGCGCFPTGRHYAGIAHLLKVNIRGLAEEIAPDRPWQEIDIALIDVETTGRDAAEDRVVEIGIAVGRGGQIVAEYNWLINPGRPIPEEARSVHGISDADVKDKPRFHQVAHEIANALAGCVPAAYNAAFDRAFVHAEFARAQAEHGASAKPALPPALRREVDWFDPLVWAREIQSDEKSRALGDVATRLGVELQQAHRASDDAKAAMLVFYKLGVDPRVPRAYGAAVQEQRRLAQRQADERRRWRN